MAEQFIWVVSENSDKTEGRGPMRDVAFCTSLEEAMAINQNIYGVMGVPKMFGGKIHKVQLNKYPVTLELVWPIRK